MSRTATTTKPSEYTAGSLHHVPPGELLLERNIRESKPSRELTLSIADVGILQAITAVVDHDGKLLVRYGHRRTLAAIELGLATVPVYVAGADDLTREAEVTRVVGQRDENTLRDNLTAAEDLASVEQLVAFGLDADQIVEQARIGRDRVDRALAVSKSKLARAATVKYSDLTLDQAAVVAEFDDDKELVKQLIVAAVEEPDQFPHVAQRARDDLAEEKARQALLAELGQAGVGVMDRRPSYDDKKAAPLDRLTDDAGKRITAAKHADCPGHAAFLTERWVWVDDDGAIVSSTNADRTQHRQVHRPVAEYACTDWKKHGHRDSYASSSSSKPAAADMSEEEREKARVERRLVIDNNKAWDSAEVVRGEWLAEFAKRKTPPKGAAAFIADTIALDRNILDDNSTRRVTLCEGWGLPTTKGPYGSSLVGAVPKGTTENRALVIALVQLLAAHESATSRQSWRKDGKTSREGRYLRFLQSAGYGLSDVEKFAIGSKTVR